MKWIFEKHKLAWIQVSFTFDELSWLEEGRPNMQIDDRIYKAVFA